MKRIVSILVLIGFISCNSGNEQQRIVYYPSEGEFSNPKFLVPIDLDTTSLNYWDLAMMTPANDYRKNVPFFEIKEDSLTKRIVPFIIESPFVKRNEVITVTMDSVFADKEYNFEQLYAVLNKIFGGQKAPEFSNYQKNPNIVRLAIDIDKNSTGKDLKIILSKTTDSFEKLKKEISDSLELILYFDTVHSLYGSH
ncbi:hypothetical protein [Flagellimonas algicola]|uniref:Uncharacterized protein n=1 Tax=Flagellimonas algicola TaxID=2583815 RepID=A0ABY2WJX8_9FLAO|nr:hypothetical protein [Allomuricauda algicola]TMU54847.1 hypothetical protein FGG15_11665 [Allomuricauda algicola]